MTLNILFFIVFGCTKPTPVTPTVSRPHTLELASCWFENPYDYMFNLPSAQPLTVNTSKYGMFSAGTHGLLYYSGAHTCLAQIGGFEIRNPWVYEGHGALAMILENLNAPSLYLDTIRDGGCGLSNYNPEAIKWMIDWIPTPDDTIAGLSAITVYQHVFSRFVRMMLDSYGWLHQQDINTEQQLYCAEIKAGRDVLMHLEARYASALSNYTIAPNGTDFLPEYAIGFWIRRSLDGTESAFLNGLKIIVERFDSQWYAQRQK